MEERIEILMRGSQYKKLRECQMSEIRMRYDLKRIEIEILYYLSVAEQNNTSADICQRLKANKGQISLAVDKLCKQNYLTAIPDTSDRRYVHYFITEAARELVEQISEKWKELNEELFWGITGEEMEELKRIAGKIGRNMERILEQQEKRNIKKG